VICYTISSTSLQSKGRSLPTEKISRVDAVERFLNATTILLCSKTPSELTLNDIAGQAELGQHYIYRFFGTRFDLLIEVSDLLAAQAGKSLQHKISDNELDFAQLLELCRSVCARRILLLDYLAAQGVRAARFQEGNRLIYTGISQFFRNSGVPTARALSNGVVVLALIHAEISLLPTLDLQTEELSDLISLFAAR
jgi:AcrR family transcriptional regulator